MAKSKEIEIKAEDLDFGEKFVGANANNPLFSGIFNQPAQVDKRDEYAKVLIKDLYDFPNHPFKVRMNNKMIELRDSIIDTGVLEPILLRPKPDGGYTILAGHRRKTACTLAQVTEIPAIIKYGLTDAEATLIMCHSNRQREEILPSERAFSYKQEKEAYEQIYRAGRPSKNNVSPEGTNFKRVDQLIADEEGVGRNTVNRYIRLTYLIPQILELVDNSVTGDNPSMALKPAVEISYLTPEEQKYFYDTVKTLDKTPSVQQATQIKELSKNGSLTQTRVMEILMADKPNQRETVRMDYDKLRDYYDSPLSPKECENKVFESLDGMKKIRSAVSKHVPKQLTDAEMATLIENLLVEHIKAHPKPEKQAEYQR